SAVEDGWLVEDAGSSNGTYVDGKRLERFRVERETTVRLGDADHGPWLRLTPVAEVASAEPTPEPAPPLGIQPTMAPTGGVRPGELTIVHELRPGVDRIGRSP